MNKGNSVNRNGGTGGEGTFPDNSIEKEESKVLEKKKTGTRNKALGGGGGTKKYKGSRGKTKKGGKWTKIGSRVSDAGSGKTKGQRRLRKRGIGGTASQTQAYQNGKQRSKRRLQFGGSRGGFSLDQHMESERGIKSD